MFTVITCVQRKKTVREIYRENHRMNEIMRKRKERREYDIDKDRQREIEKERVGGR